MVQAPITNTEAMDSIRKVTLDLMRIPSNADLEYRVSPAQYTATHLQTEAIVWLRRGETPASL